jgi:hypothetical protein
MKKLIFLTLLFAGFFSFSQQTNNKKKITYDFFAGSSSEQINTYIIPATFTDFTGDLYNTGGDSVYTTYDFTTIPNAISGTVGYINLSAPVNGSGTSVSPYNSMSLAVASSHNIFYIQGKGRNNNSKFTVTKNLKLLAWPGFDPPEITTQTDNDLVWVVNGTNPLVYDATWPSASGFINTVMDRAVLDANGVYTGYFSRGSIANVAANPGSFWYESAANTLHVRTIDGRVPDTNIVGLVAGGTVMSQSTNVATPRYLFAENIKFYGANAALSISQTGASYVFFGFNRCEFSYSGGTEACAYIPGKAKGYYRFCKALYGRDDGFDYNSTDSFTFEYYCTGGYTTWTGTAVNGSTSHNASKVLRVGGNYQYTSGKPLQDIENSYSYNLRCIAGNSIAANPNDFPYATNSIAATTTNMYLIECTRIGSKGYINFLNSILNLYDGVYGNLSTATNTNSGTLNILTTNQVYQ